MIDNYDSFTFNLVHYFQSLNQEVVVHRNDQITLADIESLSPHYIVISPGPCAPDSAGLSLAIIERFAGKIPLLGVCLGHQCIAQYFGAKIIKAKQVMHGKTCHIQHSNTGLFAQLPNPLQVARYHSLIVEKDSLPEALAISAWSCTTFAENTKTNPFEAPRHYQEIMALQHKTLPIASVQFHPEAILTEQGHALLKNFLNMYNNK